MWEVAFRATNPGIWPNHCHNLAHADQGMMLQLHYDGVTIRRLTRKAQAMPTEPGGRTRQPAGDSDDPRSNLIALTHRRCRAIIDVELDRLARRAPSLSRNELNVIEAVLQDLAETSILAPLRNASQDTMPLLAYLFGIPG